MGYEWLHPAAGGGGGGADAAAMPCARSEPQRATSRCLATAAPAAGAPSGFRRATAASAAAADSSVASTSASGGLHGRAEDSGKAHGGASAGMPTHNAPGIKRRRMIGACDAGDLLALQKGRHVDGHKLGHAGQWTPFPHMCAKQGPISATEGQA
eukprot:365655-Chlamydomonas_euryale.AAC.8